MRLTAKSQEEAGRWLGIPSTAISKMETGKQRVTSAYLKLLLQLYNVGPLTQTGSKSSAANRVNAVGGRLTERPFRTGSLTTSAWRPPRPRFGPTRPSSSPVSLQTPEYTRAVTEAMNPARPLAEVERFVEVRAVRQQRLTSDEPLILRVVINEAALRREVGGRNVMQAQAQRIVDLTQLPNVTIQVLPFSVGAHPAMLGAFTALRFPEEPMKTVYVELDSAALYLEGPAEVARYTNTFEQFTKLALDADRTTELLDRI